MSPLRTDEPLTPTIVPPPLDPGTYTWGSFSPSPQAPSPAAEPAPVEPEPETGTPREIKARAKAAQKAQAKQDKAQAKQDKAQAKQDKAQAKQDKAQAKRDQTQAKRGSAAPEATPALAAAADDVPAKSSRAVERKRSSRPAMLVIIAVLVVALVVAGGIWVLTMFSGSNATGNTPANPTAQDPLVTASDLGQLGGVGWVENTATTQEVRPLCTNDEDPALPAAQRHLSRLTAATTSEADTLGQVIDTYPDAETATTAYATRLTELSNCTKDVAWLLGGNTVNGLADQSTAIRAMVQPAGAAVYHVVLLSRTGRSVSIVDLGTTAEVKPLELATAVSPSLGRQCGPDQGACPGSIEVAATPPLPGEPVGWLLEADLPRINGGVGRWGAQDVVPAASSGSQCEAINLETDSGAETAQMRTLLYADDPAQPNGFGVDMLSYSYPDAAAANKFAKDLTKKLANCGPRTPTATVDKGPAVRGSGQDGAEISGSSFRVTQDTGTSTVIYRVAVVATENKVVYLLANPTKSFDFTDAQWKAIGLRAGQRASQT